MDPAAKKILKIKVDPLRNLQTKELSHRDFFYILA